MFLKRSINNPDMLALFPQADQTAEADAAIIFDADDLYHVLAAGQKKSIPLDVKWSGRPGNLSGVTTRERLVVIKELEEDTIYDGRGMNNHVYSLAFLVAIGNADVAVPLSVIGAGASIDELVIEPKVSDWLQRSYSEYSESNGGDHADDVDDDDDFDLDAEDEDDPEHISLEDLDESEIIEIAVAAGVATWDYARRNVDQLPELINADDFYIDKEDLKFF